jgi:hypothetical protein
MSTKHHSPEPVIESVPAKRLMTKKNGVILALFVVMPQLQLQLAYHVGSKDDLLGGAMMIGLIASFLGFVLLEVWHQNEKTGRLYHHFRDATEMLYIEIRGFVFSHAFIVDSEIEEFVRRVLPNEEEARRYHSGFARGIREARDPETYRVARREAAEGTRFYLDDQGLSNRMVDVAPPPTVNTEKP